MEEGREALYPRCLVTCTISVIKPAILIRWQENYEHELMLKQAMLPNSTEDEQVQERCRKAVEKANYFLVRHGFGEEAFEERQRQYCHCCPPPVHKDKKREMITNTENVRLVKEPKYWANDDFLFARLPKGTTVEVLDKGAGEPFNQTALEYQWWWVRAEGKEGWVMQVLLDDVTESP